MEAGEHMRWNARCIGDLAIFRHIIQAARSTAYGRRSAEPLFERRRWHEVPEVYQDTAGLGGDVLVGLQPPQPPLHVRRCSPTCYA